MNSKFNKIISNSEHESYFSKKEDLKENDFFKAFSNYIETLRCKSIKYLILCENPLSWDTYVYNPKATKGYSQIINSSFNLGRINVEKRLQEWANKGILILDIYQLFEIDKGIDLNLKIGKISYREFLMKKKVNSGHEQINYPVFRLKTSIDFIEEKDLNFSTDLKVALMMPQLTSLPILNYFSDRNQKIFIKNIEFSNAFRQINNELNINSDLEYIIFPRHKANVIGGSNIPKAELLKYALDL
jgi:hypothetical protein